MLAEEVGHLPEEVFVHAAERVALSRQQKYVEAFVGFYQGVNHSDGVCGVHVVVHVSCHKHQVTFQTAGKLLVGAYAVGECCVCLVDVFFNSMSNISGIAISRIPFDVFGDLIISSPEITNLFSLIVMMAFSKSIFENFIALISPRLAPVNKAISNSK